MVAPRVLWGNTEVLYLQVRALTVNEKAGRPINADPTTLGGCQHSNDP